MATRRTSKVQLYNNELERFEIRFSRTWAHHQIIINKENCESYIKSLLAFGGVVFVLVPLLRASVE